MKILIDEIDGAFFADLIITPEQLLAIQEGLMIEHGFIYKRRKCYVGLRLQESQKEWYEEDVEGEE